MLRTHIESIPIPAVTEDGQRAVTELADRLISETGLPPETAVSIYDDIDRRLAEYYGLAPDEYRIILERIPGVRLLPSEAKTAGRAERNRAKRT